jgi:aldose 1-epimerase
MEQREFGKLDDGTSVAAMSIGGGDLEVEVLTYGAIVQSLRVPDVTGEVDDVVLGFDDLSGYVGTHPYFGAVIGRYANRIAKGRFSLDGKDYEVPVNNGPNSLHGGTEGFDRRVWSVEDSTSENAVTLRLVSPDGDMGYPGELTATVTYTVEGSDLRVDYTATTDAPTVLNLTNHSYFNLAGQGSGTVENHRLELDAARFTRVDDTAIPTGELAGVDGTPMDFRSPKRIGESLRTEDEQLLWGQGYDHNWVLDDAPEGSVRRAARVVEPAGGRVLEVWTDQPGVQFYSGNFLDGTIVGKAGRIYRQGDAFCLETQHFPDSPNQRSFPSTVLRPGETFTSTTVFRFSTA